MYTRVLFLALFMGVVSVAYTAPLASEARGGAWREQKLHIETQVREYVHEVKEHVDAVRTDVHKKVRNVRERIENERHRWVDTIADDDAVESPDDTDDDVSGDEGQQGDGAEDDEGAEGGDATEDGSDESGTDDGEPQEGDTDTGTDDSGDDGTGDDAGDESDSGDSGQDEGADEDDMTGDDGADDTTDGEDPGTGTGDDAVDDDASDGDEGADDGAIDEGEGDVDTGGDEGANDDPTEGEDADGDQGGTDDSEDGTGDDGVDAGGGGGGDEEPVTGKIVITEVLYNPGPTAVQGTDDYEWVELYNGTSKDWDIAGWSIGDGAATDVLSGETFVVSPGQRLIVARYASTSNYWVFAPGTALVALNSPIGNTGLTNGGESVILYDASGSVVDAVSWGVKSDSLSAPELVMLPSVPVGTIAEGESIYRLDPTIDTDTAADWGIHEPNPGW